MRVGLGGGGEGERVLVRKRWRKEEAEGGGGGCSGSSTSHGSSLCDSPLPSFVRHGGGGPGSDLELDGLPTSSSNASSGSQEEDHGPLQGVKEEGWIQVQGPIKNTAAHSTGECQDQRYRLGSDLFHGRTERKQRPASVDFGCPNVDKSSTHSPGFLVNGAGMMNKGLGVSSQNKSGVPTSPGTPGNNRRGVTAVGYQQGWSSERVPLSSNGQRRYPGNSMVLPHNTGRTLPSKWEDAERWIFSPNPSNALGRTSIPQSRRPKAKSGPLGPPGRFGEPYSSVSSSSSLLDNGRVGNLKANSPFLAGVLLPEHVCGGNSHTGRDLKCVSGDDSSNGLGVASGVAHGAHPSVWSTRVYQQLNSAFQSSQSSPTSQESAQACTVEQIEITTDSTTSNKPAILRKDVATQTSPERSRSSSPSGRSSFSRSLSVQQVKELESCFSKLEIRDVQMDDRVTLTRWSKKHVTRGSENNSTNIIEWKKKTVESKSSAWEVTETAKCISKVEGEEAKMTAWENMQKAKAEAAIQKLVMKLEKKRSYSLERIFNTLRSANRKTHVIRSTTTTNLDQHISRTVKRPSHLSKNGQMSSLSGCFTCHAF
uniref:Remorin C-terminal domain-containing protein n=1 Tax=Leersia perrieri TaxID=77586 RepID=A0A0D9X8T1_9ORYZ